MSLNQSYIYIRDNIWYSSENIFKVGITTSIKDRSNSYITGELYRGFYIKIYELNINPLKLKLIDNLFKKDFKHLNIYFDGGTEFYDRCIINLIETFLIENKIDFISKTEDELKRINRDKTNIINKFLKFYIGIINLNKEILRDYQIQAIAYITEQLKINNKSYLHLATGAGKSKIAINVISNIKPLNIIIFSPRITIKNQNISNKYLDILNENDFQYNIYSYCYQSYKNVYNLIIKNNIKDIFIWFDESHWALDNWVSISIDDTKDKDENNNENAKIKQFFINDNNYIKYRLFTTASPNKDLIINNEKYYGKLYEPIKFKELKNKYLCDIEVEIFDKEIEMERIEYNSLIFNTFNKHNQERKLGFSFHNTCNSAYLSYLHHLKDFNDGKIDIKPYLLINEEFIKKEILNNNDNKDNDNDNDNNNNKEDLKVIKKIKKDIGNIDYYNEISNFENEVNNNQKALGYVVAKYSIGYDNKNIDIIYFTDYKLSYKDIIQSIGRGTRLNGDKKLRIILPTNSNNDIGRNYKKIENVLKYLLIDIELDYDNIKSYKLVLETNKELKIENEIQLIMDDNSYHIIEDIDVKSSINTMKHNIIAKANDWTISKVIIQLKRNNIHTIEDYNLYSKKNKNINLPDINELLENDSFNFRDTYNNESECPYYYNKNECIEVIKSYDDYFIINYIIDDLEKLKYLIENDEKIPKMNLWIFYGGKRSDYYSY
uniref:Helicase ATP-binding domain-containing protein n=1 Tax=viral metagenome TaxID=1070528 RepID=A0A6C0ETT7_9ZZZZ